MPKIADGPSASARKSSSVDSSVDVLRIDLRCIPSRRFPDFPANNSRPVHRRPVPASQTPLGEIHSGHQCSLVDWISKYRPRAAARKNPGPARRKVKSPPPENHFPVPRGASASKGDIASPREIISPFRSRVVRASKGESPLHCLLYTSPSPRD